MKHEIKDYTHLISNLTGLSDKQIEQHLGLYKGYVNKYNEIIELLQTADRSKSNYSFGDFSELKRRQVVAYNGTILHELYFDALSKDGKPISDKMKKLLSENFGSYEEWEKDLRSSAVSTPGWVLLARDMNTNKLSHWVIYEHHIGLPANHEIILALDCWEHSFMIDYGTAKANYLDAFLKNLNWEVIESRL